MPDFIKPTRWHTLLRPVTTGLRKCLPDLAEAWSGISAEFKRDPALKSEAKRSFGFAMAFDTLELSVLTLPAFLMRHSPALRAQAAHLTHDFKIPKFLKPTHFEQAEARVIVKANKWQPAIAGCSGILDTKLLSVLLRADRRHLKRSLGVDPTDEPRGLMASAREAIVDISAGLQAEPGLKKKFVALAAAEMVSDMIDARMGLSRNFPGLAASMLISQVIGIKEFDLTARAFRLGVTDRPCLPAGRHRPARRKRL